MSDRTLNRILDIGVILLCSGFILYAVRLIIRAYESGFTIELGRI